MFAVGKLPTWKTSFCRISRSEKGSAMWIFLNDAFVSIVAHKDDPDKVVVRARVRGDIENVFGDVEVIETDNSDYRFRAFLPREMVANVVWNSLMDVDYTNFKDSVKENRRHDAYLGVWDVMRRLQDELYGNSWWLNYRNHR